MFYYLWESVLRHSSSVFVWKILEPMHPRQPASLHVLRLEQKEIVRNRCLHYYCHKSD